MNWIGYLGAAAAAVVSATATYADETCSLAGNGICEEVVLGPGYCAPATDTSDCAAAEVLPFSDDRPLTDSDVRYFDDTLLRLARNEIFARHGYRFNSADLQQFYGARSWYTPVGQDVSLSALEQANVEFLRQREGVPLDQRSALQSRQPDGASLPPWTAWQADLVHANGAVDQAMVNGIRGRVHDPVNDWTVMVRPDREDQLYFGPDQEIGAIGWWALFPPIILEPFVLAFEIVPQPIGRETLLGESVTRVRLDWEDPGWLYHLARRSMADGRRHLPAGCGRRHFLRMLRRRRRNPMGAGLPPREPATRCR